MTTFLVTDPAINARCGIFQAPHQDAALDAAARLMGWKDYTDYLAGAANHNGIRSLEAQAIVSPIAA